MKNKTKGTLFSIAETDAGNARPPRVILAVGLGGVAATFVGPSAYELQFFCQVDWSATVGGQNR